MRSESPEERRRQKVVKPPSYRIENEYNPEAIPQYFQISVGVLEGRNYSWPNPRSTNSYVIVALGKKKCRTSIRRNKKEPHYREYFSFGMYASVYDLQRYTLSLTVMEPRCYAPSYCIGEANIDLGTVWTQLYFQPFRKWMQLSLSRYPMSGSMGFLKVDISIKGRGGVSVIPVPRENMQVNYMLSSTSEQQHANFIITIHSAFGLPNSPRHPSDKYYVKSPNTFVRVSFCGLQAKTTVQNLTNNPMYNEQVSMVEMFPSSNPIVRFEICSTDAYATRLLASKSLNLDHVSHDGENGFLPTFGPSLLPIYGSSSMEYFAPIADSPFYRGSLLISLRIVVPYHQQSLRSISVEPVIPISVKTAWILKSFCIFCPIFEVSMLDSRFVNDLCGIAVTIGEIPTESTPDADFMYIANEVRTRKLHYTGSLDVLRTKSELGYLDFSNTYPVLQSIIQLPDYRFRMYKNNAIYRIVRILNSTVKKVECRLKNGDYTTPKDLLEELNETLNEVARDILQFLNNNSSDTNESIREEKCKTELDKKQFILQMDEMKRIREKMLLTVKLNNTSKSMGQHKCIENKYNGEMTRRSVKCMLSEMHKLIQEIEKLIFKATEGLPDLIIWLLTDGSRIGYSKIPVGDIIYSDFVEECGMRCGRIQTIYFKPLKCTRHVNSLSMGCFCNVGKVELLAWMGLHEHSSAFEPCLPNGYKLKIKQLEMCIKCNGIMIECRVFIYKARLLCEDIAGSLGNVYLRIHVLNTEQDSKAVEKTSLPIWNQLLRCKKMVYMSADRMFKYPPVVLVEVNSTNLSGKTELIGSFEMESVVEDYDSSIPKLRWYEMYKGMENTGKVHMSVQILPVPERALKSTIYTPIQQCYISSDVKEFDNNSLFDIEQLPTDLIPRTSTYKLDIYWWGLRNVNVTRKPCVVLEIEDVTVKSEIINNKRSNCNFPNGRVSSTFDASFNERLCPSINVKLYDNCTFGRTIHMGTSAVKKPDKFFIYWHPKVERDASLKQISVMSADFVKVSPTLYVKRNTNKIDDGDELCHRSTNIDSKRSIWRRLFCNREPDEEEYTLLPSFTEKCTNKKVKKNQTMEQMDWWSRYIYSQKSSSNIEGESVNPGDKLIIYDSELELQPQFSKFRDWCATLKFYSNEKNGTTDREEEIHCGYLKVGLAIYQWPPPDKTVAVSDNGIDLSQGFFHKYPNNESAKFLVRVYIIKGIDLIIKNIAGKSYPFVIVSCGNKQLGDRSRTISNSSSNPIFGTVYELRCTLPEEYQLTISLYNHGSIEHDELIGSTTIDLENRIYTKHRAMVGLAPEYNLKWRDCSKPSVILEEICARNQLSRPSFPSFSSVMVNGVEYKDNECAKNYASILECRENVCLSILNNWDKLQVCGYPLVPEHVETRSLYNPDIPGIEQGKIHIWIDIFPFDLYIPPPVDIIPRKTEVYELKLTILKVKLFKKNVLENMPKSSGLYVRVWMGFLDQMQNTNCRSVSSDGFYIFNRSMIFSFKYDYTERKLLKTGLNQFTDYEENVIPELRIHVMDDSLSLYEPIGRLILNLNEMPQGEREPKYATDNKVKKKIINLFSITFVRAWWFLKTFAENSGENVVGAIKLEITLLPKQKTTVMAMGSQQVIQTPSSQEELRLKNKNSLQSNCLKRFFCTNNAAWRSLTKIFIILLIITIIIYFILCTI